MKVRMIIDANVPDNIANQIKRNGLTISRSGSNLRLRVGGQLIARDQAVVTLTIEDPNAKVCQAVS